MGPGPDNSVLSSEAAEASGEKIMSLQCCAALDTRPSLQPLHLVEEITHRVVNEYTEAICFLALTAVSADSQTRAALSMVADRLRAQVEAHRALQAPFTDGFMDLADYVEQICVRLSKSPLAQNGVRLTVRTEEIWLDAARCWRVGLIVAELIRNAARHGLRGGPGSILVEISETSGWISCLVSDNGHGASGWPSGRGGQLVQALAGELGGSIDWRFGRHGCRACVEFPLQDDEVIDQAITSV
jgi:two-component sensor histidine kinase